MKKLIAVILILIMLPVVPVKAIETSAKSAVVMDGISGEILYAKNSDERLSMASTTKIMTALLLCEQGDLEKIVTVTREMVYVEGTSMGLKVGDKVSLNDLLYGMLLSSGNDAANATAIAVGGSIENFVFLMNKKAEELGLNNTHFNTPSGLDGDSHYTTSYDLAKLTLCALNNCDFYKASSTKTKTVKIGDRKVTLSNHNRLLSAYDGAIGVKTGFTKKSGRCLVTAAERDGARVIAVTLNDKNDWKDHTEMLNYGFSRIDNNIVFNDKEYEIPVFGGEEKTVKITSQKAQFKTVTGKNIEKIEYILPYLYAPVKAGEVIGYIEYKSDGYTVAKQTLYAENDIKAKENESFSKRVKFTFLNMLRI